MILLLLHQNWSRSRLSRDSHPYCRVGQKKKTDMTIVACPVLYRLHCSNYQPASSVMQLPIKEYHSLLLYCLRFLPSLNMSVSVRINSRKIQTWLDILMCAWKSFACRLSFFKNWSLCVALVLMPVSSEQRFSPVSAWILPFFSQLTVPMY